jgi:hypothetical protein
VVKYYMESRLRAPRASLLQLPAIAVLSAMAGVNIKTLLIALTNMFLILNYLIKDDNKLVSDWSWNPFKIKAENTSGS